MNITQLAALLNENGAFTPVSALVMNDENAQLKGLAGSSAAFMVYRLKQEFPDRAIFCASDPSNPFDTERVKDSSISMERNDVLGQLDGDFKGILICSALSVMEKFPGPELIRKETSVIEVGQSLAPEDLIEILTLQGFSRTDYVNAPGELALRGGILDVYPYSGEYPIRIEYFGDDIDSIREFDPTSQRSVSRLTKTNLVPNVDLLSGDSERLGLLESLPKDSILILDDWSSILGKIDERNEQLKQFKEKSDLELDWELGQRYTSADQVEALKSSFLFFRSGDLQTSKDLTQINLDFKAQRPIGGTIKVLREHLSENADRSFKNLILCDSNAQANRLEEILEDVLNAYSLEFSVETLHQGFLHEDSQISVFTDHEIFDRFHRPSSRKRKKKFGGLSINELRSLKIGDFVVHIDYGIGKFDGLEKIEVRSQQQEAVRVFYRGKDLLYVNVNSLHKLHKYSGKEGHQPSLTKLGTGQWERAKSKTKKRVKDIARDLIKLYARRKNSKGYAFSNDTVWQREMEASFEFEDTPDQGAAAEATKADMELEIPMDRLVCGDVGFGKTEIAIRAAFKAAQDGKQVAVLVPTTILAAQHEKSFKKRLGTYPVKIASLSRFNSTEKGKEIVKEVAEGTVDIVIGTHRLVSKDVKFKDLGLIIVDEEQRFGVAVKEKLRKFRANVDTLTLTATPIPRTLQFSLMGARDLSLIHTPPPNRQPINTEIHSFDKELIRDAILYEINRGGQVFFVHNRVQSIEETSGMIRALIPDIRIKVGHGQMPPKTLEKIMTDFVNKKFDVLVSTNIIESGLDVANANTMIINRAEMFGLSDLHQMRGRVGRSDKKAFCYLLTKSVHSLTRAAKQRLQALEEFSDLGSGFNIAMRDLDIRGAGNLLGAEQSGFVNDVGFEAYHRILDEAVQELRSDEFSELFDTDGPPPNIGESVVDISADALVTKAYVSDSLERLKLYRKLSDAKDEDSLIEFLSEIEDRFGPAPVEVHNLVIASQLKLLAEKWRFSRVAWKNERLFLTMPDKADSFFYENYFQSLMDQLEKIENRVAFKESGKKYRMIVQNVPKIEDGVEILSELKIPDTSQF